MPKLIAAGLLAASAPAVTPTTAVAATNEQEFLPFVVPDFFNGPNLMCEPGQDTITAFATGGKANATPLTQEINRITVCATAGDSVLLPPTTGLPAGQSLSVLVLHHGAAAAQVFGSGTDTINDVATANGVSQMPSSGVLYICTTAGAWYTLDLATGFSGNFATQSFLGGLTAHAGGTQGAALPITTMTSRFTVVGSAGDSALLPPTVANITIGPITVTNAAGVNAMNVFPAVGDQINALGANTAFSLAAGKTATFYSAGAGQWHAVLSA